MIARDKIEHAVVGACIVAVLLPFGLWVAAAGLTFVAIGKELRDARGHGTPEVADFLATVLGGWALIGWYAMLGSGL